MGFADIIVDGSYSQVRYVVYDKVAKYLAFNLTIYHTSEKLESFAKIDFLFNMGNRVPSVIAKQNKPPVDPKDGDWYAVGAIPTGAWSEYKENTLVEWNSEGAIWNIIEDQLIYLETNGKYYTPVDGKLTVSHTVTDSRVWDKFFDVSKIGVNNNTDIVKQCYLFLKSRPEYTNAIDV